MIKIKDLQDGYTLEYDETGKIFCIMLDKQFHFHGETQDKVEAKFDKYIKSITNARCPLAAITTNGMEEVIITSFVSDSLEVWVTKNNGRGKYSLNNYSNKPQFFEAIEGNKAIISKYQDAEKLITKLRSEQLQLEKLLTNPLTPESFKK